MTDAVTSLSLPDASIQERVRRIHEDVLANSRYIREPDFTVIHPGDLEFLFGAYDERFFGRLCQRALGGRRMSFRLSPRMTRAGGKTTRFRTQTGMVSYEIAIASSMLFDGFGKMHRRITVCGLDCENRLEALQRIFEHEVVHLAEQLCWENSDCAATRFQDIAKRFFLHRAHTHNLVTRRERAALSGIGLGSRVAFLFEGRRLTGRVNRITKRATVLVEDTEGQKYSDGLRYKTYYVPIVHLELV
ncbi:MAG: SprT-like family protein [Bryobacteraceae bacterium]